MTIDTETVLDIPSFNPETGKGLLWKPIDENRDTFHYDNQVFEFVDYWPTNKNGDVIHKIRAAHCKGEMSCYSYTYHYISIFHICLEELKKMEIWSILSEDLHKQLELRHVTIQETAKTEVSDRMAHARRHRSSDPEYDGIPRELTCTNPTCGNMDKTIKVSPMMVIKQAQRKQQTVEEYVKSWKCSECEPRRRGKAANPKWAHIVKELHCHHPECGKVLVQHPSQTEKQAIASGKKYQEFVDTWMCREHRPEGDKLRRGRKANPNSPWKDKAKELKCACGKVLVQHPSQTDKQAKAVGKSYEEFVASWQCKKCRPKKEHHFSSASRAERAEKALTDTTTTTIVRRGRVRNPEYDGIPKETSCKVCGTVVKLVPENIIGKAKVLGITIDELIKTYKCRKCGGRLPKQKK